MTRNTARYTLFCTLFCAMAGGAGPMTTDAFSHPQTPDTIQGVWSSPDCVRAEKIWVISQHFYMHADSAGRTTGRITQWRRDDNHGDTLYYLTIAGQPPIFINRTNDGLMKTLRLPIEDHVALHTKWGWTQDEVADEYSRCEKLFAKDPPVTQNDVNQVYRLDDLLRDCNAVPTQDIAPLAHVVLPPVSDRKCPARDRIMNE